MLTDAGRLIECNAFIKVIVIMLGMLMSILSLRSAGQRVIEVSNHSHVKCQDEDYYL